MNIIKLIDKIMPESEVGKIFNTYFKGKYAFLVQMRYIYTFNDLVGDNYKKCEQNPSQFQDIPYIDLEALESAEVKNYIDEVKTQEANSISFYEDYNKYVPDSEITLEELKNFRTWLADRILAFNIAFPEDIRHMLEYYAGGMYDDVVKYLSIFGESVTYKPLVSGGCQCCAPTNTPELMNGVLPVCDALKIYRLNIYNKMVEVFSDVQFWLQFNKEFIKEFKKYIDNIITSGLIIRRNNKYEYFVECCCSDNILDKDKEILNRLSDSLEFIIKDEQNSNKNYIYKALNDWASLLYEQMQWNVEVK